MKTTRRELGVSDREAAATMFQALHRLGALVSSSFRAPARRGAIPIRASAPPRADADGAAPPVADVGAADVRQIEFLAFAAHELRSPLAPIRTAAALITLCGPAELPRAQAIIERQVAHMSRMIDDLLDLSRSATGKLQLVLSHLDISAPVERAVEASLPAMIKRRQRLEVRGLAGDCFLCADVVRLTQVFSNLLDNASKYSPDGECIFLDVRRVDPGVELVVADNGIGIAASALERIFLPFAQDARATGFDASGLGLGLAVVRELVTAHGGRVTAHSEGVGQGSRFVVTLPCGPASACERT